MTAVQKSGFDAGYASAQYQMWPRTDEAQEKRQFCARRKVDLGLALLF
jgi:hypothetical protein